MSLTYIRVPGTFKAELCPALKSPGLNREGARCSGKMVSGFSREQGRRAQSSRSVCGQEERFTLKRISSWLPAGPGLVFLGAKLIWAESGGISLKPMEAISNLLPSEPRVLFQVVLVDLYFVITRD